MDIDIKDIKTLKNARTDIGDVSELMGSIRQHGLLQPIGLFKTKNEYIVAFGNRRLYAVKKLGWKTLPEGTYKMLPETLDRTNFIALNTIENLHREDITPLEFGKVVKELRDANLNLTEIAVLLGTNRHRVKTAYHIFSRIPEKYANMIGYDNKTKNERGKVKATTVERLLSRGSKNTEAILEYAHKESLSGDDVNTLAILLERGIPFDKAKNNLEKYHMMNVKFLVDTAEENRLYEKYGVKSIVHLITAIIKKVEPNLLD